MKQLKEMPVLVGERLILRPFELKDAKRVQMLAGTPEIAAVTLLIPYPYPDGLAETWIGTHRESFQNGQNVSLAVCLKDSGLLIGAVGLEISQEHSRGSLGYWIGTDYWNQGYCTEAAILMVDHGFNEMSLARIYATHMSHNPASGRVMQKLGMQKEGVLRNHILKNGKYYDLVYYGILRSEYETIRT